MKRIVVIPCFNESLSILKVVEDIKKNALGFDYIIVNDCSTDNTLSILEKNRLNYVSLPCNLGIGGAVQCGYKYAYENGYDIAVQMDGDGQHDAIYLKDIVAPVENGECDMAIGSRFFTKDGFQSSFLRRIGINIISFFIKICCGKKILDTTSGFRACNKKMIKYFISNYAQDYPEPEAIISTVLRGGKVKEVPVMMKEREDGCSSIHGFKSLYYMIKVPLSLVVYRLSVKKGEVK